MNSLFRIILFISTFLFIQNVFASCYDIKLNAQNYSSQADSSFNLWKGTKYNDPKYNAYFNGYQEYNNLYQAENSKYISCKSNAIKIFNEGYDAFEQKKFQSAINFYLQYLSENGDSEDSNYKLAKSNLLLAYNSYANIFFLKKDYDNAIIYYNKSLEIESVNYTANIYLGLSYYNKNELNNALLYLQSAYNVASNKIEIDAAQDSINLINSVISEQNELLNAPSKDTYSYKQYYLKDLNIHTAWKQVTNPKQVIVAVIDDGININHPDLLDRIWISNESEYGSNKIIDFVGDNMPDNLPSGQHGTMVAGIIGANSNNNEGIAGIAKNVKLMPLRVFPYDKGAKEEDIIKALNFAISNGANIINLSLGQSQFKYSNKYDEIIKKAYDLGIVVVIAGGNGDLLTNQDTGVNLDANPISPVCNNKGNDFSFGVFATDAYGYRTKWTNYGKCTPFFAPGEGIISTSIPVFNSKYGDNYNKDDGTSFSAPIISGIIALGFNKYGKIEPSIIFQTLKISTTLNKNNQPFLDANKYLSNLESYFNKQILTGAKIKFQKYKKEYSNLSSANRAKKFQDLLKLLQNKGKKLGGDLKKENDYIIDLIYKELGMQNNNKTSSNIQKGIQGNTSLNPITVVTIRPKVVDNLKK